MYFLSRKNHFLSLKFFLENWKSDIYEYLKTFHERQKFMSEKASNQKMHITLFHIAMNTLYMYIFNTVAV